MSAPPAPAAPMDFPVTDAGDSGAGTLREAFNLAQANLGDDSITVMPGLGTIMLTSTIAPPGTTDDVVLNGNGVTIKQTAAGNGVIFYGGAGSGGTLAINDATITGVTSGGFAAVHGGADVVLNDVTVKDNTTDSNAAGIYAGGGSLTLTNSVLDNNHSTANVLNFGGAYASSLSSVTNSRITNNSATGTAGSTVVGGVALLGGGTITDSTISGNTATDSGGAGVAVGGVYTAGVVTLTRSTVSGNTASTTSGDAVGGVGAAITGLSYDVHVENSTITNNTATGTGLVVGGLAGKDVTLTYATVVENTGADAANVHVVDGLGMGALVSFGSVAALPGGGPNCVLGTGMNGSGYNYEADTNTCGFTLTGDVNGGPDPQLGALADNGGPTLTRLPAFGSPLVNAIPSGDCAGFGGNIDQRGVARPAEGACDKGAVEGHGASPPACPAAVLPGMTGGSLAGAEGVVAVTPLGLQVLLRRRRRRGLVLPRRERVRSIVTWLMVAGVAVAVLAACQPVKKTPPIC